MSQCSCPYGKIAFGCQAHGANRQPAAAPVNETPRSTPGEPQTHIEETVQWLRLHAGARPLGHVVLTDAADIIEALAARDAKRASAPQSAPFPLGTTVRLKSGGPAMTVIKLDTRTVAHVDSAPVMQTEVWTKWITQDGAWHCFSAPSECFEMAEVKS